MEKQKIKIVRKNDEYSAEYQVGDVFQVDSTWYGGVNVTSASGIPLSLDKDEYVLLEEAEKEQPLTIILSVWCDGLTSVKWWRPALKSWQ